MHAIKNKIIYFVVCLLGLTLMACELAYPEVVVKNNTDEHIMLRNLSFSGCKWETLLSFGDATSLDYCLPGEDKIHFEKFDAESYLINEEPTWFNYQTVSVKTVSYAEFHLFEIVLDDMEQDFSVPGPYAH